MSGQTSWARLVSSASTAPTGRWLTDVIEERILNGELPPGTRLPSERQLADWMRLSRPAVREALRALTARGYLDVVPGRGAFVREVSLADAARPLERLYWRRATPREVVEARRMLESEAAGLAALRAEAADLAIMESAISSFDDSADPLARARHDLAFHFAVVRAAHNPVLEAMFGSISRLTVEMMLRSLSDPNITRAGVPFHHHILGAIRRKDAAGARAAVIGHLQVAEQLYGSDFDLALDDVARREARRLFGTALSLDHLLAIIVPPQSTESVEEFGDE